MHKAQEKERTASQGVSELNARITRLESQVSSYRAERSRLEAELELERNKVGTLEDASSRESAKYDAMVKKYQKLIEDANLDKVQLHIYHANLFVLCKTWNSNSKEQGAHSSMVIV